MSHVTCHVSRVTCHMSRVTCHVSHVIFFIFFLQSGEAYRWRVCYQRGLPRLVFFLSDIYLFLKFQYISHHNTTSCLQIILQCN